MAKNDDMASAIRAVKAAPEDEAAWDSLEELVDNRQQPDDVSGLFTEVLAGALDVEVANAVGQRAVRFHESWYGEDSGACSIRMRSGRSSA